MAGEPPRDGDLELRPVVRPRIQEDGARPTVETLRVIPSPAVSPENSAPPEDDPAAALADRHVVLVGIHYTPEMSGIGPHTTAIARRLAALADRVTVLTGVPHHPPGFMSMIYRRTRRTYARDGDVHVVRHRHPVPRRREGFGWARYEAGFVRAALGTPLPVRPDVVIGVTPSVGGAVVAQRLARQYGVPLVLVVQNVLRADRSRTGLMPYLVDRAEGRALRGADRVVVVDEDLREPVLSHGVRPGAVVQVPNPSRRAWARMTCADARERMGWEPSGRIALHAGNLGVAQDIPTIVAAARILAARGDRTRVVLAGDGSQRRVFEEVAGRELPLLHFVDPVSAADYPSLLAAADVLLLTERPDAAATSDGAGNLGRLGSHLRAARPLIAALDPAGEAARRAADYRGAVLPVPAGDAVALADAIAGLCGSHDELARRGRVARALADVELQARRDGSERLIGVIADVLGVSTRSDPAPR